MMTPDNLFGGCWHFLHLISLVRKNTRVENHGFVYVTLTFLRGGLDRTFQKKSLKLYKGCNESFYTPWRQESFLSNSLFHPLYPAKCPSHTVGVSKQWLNLWTDTGEGNGNPLQCSCLENPRDGGAWWAAVYGVTQSWTWLKWLSSNSSSRQHV